MTHRFLVSFQRTSGVHVNPKNARGNCPFFIMWRLWCKAMGEKTSLINKEADVVAIIRTVILVMYMTTNVFIVSGVIRHWNPPQQGAPCYNK